MCGHEGLSDGQSPLALASCDLLGNLLVTSCLHSHYAHGYKGLQDYNGIVEKGELAEKVKEVASQGPQGQEAAVPVDFVYDPSSGTAGV